MLSTASKRRASVVDVTKKPKNESQKKTPVLQKTATVFHQRQKLHLSYTQPSFLATINTASPLRTVVLGLFL